VFSRRLEGSKGETVVNSPEEYVAILMNQSTKSRVLDLRASSEGSSGPLTKVQDQTSSVRPGLPHMG